MKSTITDITIKKGKTTKRYPNLSTVLMVESVLKKNRDLPISMSVLRKKLPKQVMYLTLQVILTYLWESGKIIYGPKGIQWIYTEPEHLTNMLKDSLEL